MESEKKLTTALIVACGLLGIAVLIIYLMHRDNKMEQELKHGQEIAYRDAVSKIKASYERRDSVNLEERRLESAHIAVLEVSANRLKQANTGLSKELAILRPQIQTQLDTLPAIKRYVELSDSSLKQKDHIIDTLTSQTIAQQQAYDREKSAHDSTRIDFKAATDTLQLQADNLSVLLLKAEKKAKRKFSVGPVVSYGVSKDGLSHNFGIGITYSLFKF